jgi:5-methylthioadenosine/S-adenosylhomocysteine deaminase
MPAVLADLSIATRWIVPMRSRDEVLENHTLVVRDGRILDILPTREAANRYVAAIRLDRPDHLVLPGLVNAGVQIAPAVQGPGRGGALLCIAELLRAGTTCFCSVAHAPADSARIAAEQGLRAVIGLPIGSGEHFTDGLQLRDEYREHPSITTAFAPHGPGISDATFARIATLANELDAGIVMSLHESPREIAASVAAYGLRPMERMHSLGLLTPALTALHMAHVTAADVELAQRSGIAVVLCPQSSMRGGFGTPPVASWMTCDLAWAAAPTSPPPVSICGATCGCSPCCRANQARRRHRTLGMPSLRPREVAPRHSVWTRTSAAWKSASGRICAVSICIPPRCNEL